jgi:hypothetical protein
MANEDISSEFRRQNEPLSYYWRAVMSAMDAAISVPQTLQNGFWPSSRFAPTVEDEYIWITAQCAKNTPKMPRLWDVGMIVLRHHFVSVVMYMMDTFLRCDRQMAICARSGLLVQSATRTQTLVTAIRFRFNIRDPIPFSTLMQTRMQGGIQRKGMCGVRTMAFCHLGLT